MASPDTTIWFRNNWHLRPRARRVDIGGTVVGVASLDDIIASKEALGGAKDLGALPALYETRRQRDLGGPDPC